MICPNCGDVMKLARLDEFFKVEWERTFGCDWCGCTVKVREGDFIKEPKVTVIITGNYCVGCDTPLQETAHTCPHCGDLSVWADEDRYPSGGV